MKWIYVLCSLQIVTKMIGLCFCRHAGLSFLCQNAQNLMELCSRWLAVAVKSQGKTIASSAVCHDSKTKKSTQQSFFNFQENGK
jgi:hypothetical protein